MLNRLQKSWKDFETAQDQIEHFDEIQDYSEEQAKFKNTYFV